MAEAMVAAEAASIAKQLLGDYNKAPESTKKKIFFGVDILNQGGSRVLKLPVMLLTAAINFFILAFIFILTLRAKLKALFDAGDISQREYMRNAFVRGLGYALLAVAILFISDLISGGYASLFMLAIYPLAGIATLIMSVINPSFLNDIKEPNPDVDGGFISRTSGFRLWSISFWTIFIMGMITAIVVGIAMARVGNKLTRGIFDVAASIVGRMGEDTPSRSINASGIPEISDIEL